MRRPLIPITLLLVATSSAPGAVVRGKVVSSLGVPVPGARVQLIRLTGGSRSVAQGIAGVDGSYELRTGLGGHFVLLTSPPLLSRSVAPQIGIPFYAGRNDLLTRTIALNPREITPQDSAQPTGRETPLTVLAEPVAQVEPTSLRAAAAVTSALRDQPGALAVEYGPTGNPARLYLRGASPSSIAVDFDGVSAEDLGGSFNLSTLAATGLAGSNSAPAAELQAVPLPRRGVDAEAGALSLHAVRASSVRPSLTYAGDAGPLDTLRNEVVASAAPGRADLLASFSRFDTANEGPAAPFHLATAAVNLGYGISAGTTLRATARRDVLAGPLPLPFELFALPPSGRDAQQNLYSTLHFATCTARDWCNGLQYGLARKRTQRFDPETARTGLPIVVVGANGYRAEGVATLPPIATREDFVTDRDEFTYTSSYTIRPFLAVNGQLAYRDERGADLLPTLRQSVGRRHLLGSLALQGELLHRRVFYQASGFVDHSNLLDLTGAPQFGLTYAPVRPGARRFRGTVLHLDFAAGLREPSLAEQETTPHPASPHTRSLNASADQTLLPGRLTLHAAYFHTQFAHQFELLAFRMPSQTLAYRTQGLESGLSWQPSAHVLFQGGYTYLAALVEQSAATPAINPAYPALAIGTLTALRGARPFHRPPNSGFASVHYGGRLLTASLRASAAGRSDDSTNLPQSPALLLPNRNLSPGYALLDADVAFAATHRITVYSDLTNLLGDRHIAPIGYTSTPFVARTGLRITIGGE